MSKIHIFNTGRLYTYKGQRIAWIVLSTGNIGMCDIDRGIDYILMGKFTEPDFVRMDNNFVLDQYDYNREVPWNRAEHDEFQSVKQTLQSAAKQALLRPIG